jgi:SnoaL-like domain
MKKKIKHVCKGIALTATLFFLFFTTGCNNSSTEKPAGSAENDRKQITALLDSFNIAAANADYNSYFNFYTDDAVFIGTDATEHWDKKAFMIWAKPYFDKKTTWNFTSLERHIYFDKTGSLAWFDELLNTQMKICRGSGVVVKQDAGWKVQQYVLSTTVPNSLIDSVVKIKAPVEDAIITTLTKK